MTKMIVLTFEPEDASTPPALQPTGTNGPSVVGGLQVVVPCTPPQYDMVLDAN